METTSPLPGNVAVTPAPSRPCGHSPEEIAVPLIRNVPIFAGLEESALKILSEQSQTQAYAAGDIIVREGEKSNVMFLITSGKVRICKHFGHADVAVLAMLGPGEFFGEMCILETLPRSATAQAVEPTTLLSLSSMAWYHLFQRMPAQHSILILNIARDLSRRLRRIDEMFAARH
jgi:CRP-like cAMP-binding protein